MTTTYYMKRFQDCDARVKQGYTRFKEFMQDITQEPPTQGLNYLLGSVELAGHIAEH